MRLYGLYKPHIIKRGKEYLAQFLIYYGAGKTPMRAYENVLRKAYATRSDLLKDKRQNPDKTV